jgi:VWFA-related protein
MRPRFNMRELAEVTGGRMFAVVDVNDLERIYDEIAVELGQQYWLGYTPTHDRAEGFRRVSVRIETREGLRARTRSGYQSGASRRPVSPASRVDTSR